MAVKHRKKSAGGLPAKGRLRDMADALWSLAVRDDWANKCAVCGSRDCEAHHLVPRQHEATRYDLRNGIALCCHCHQFDRDLSPHQNSAGWIKWLEWHHPTLAEWYFEHCRPKFEGTKNAAYYCGVIQSFREYVEPVDFDRVVGVKFGRHLEESYTKGI
jgi:hypothetical protein